MYKVQYKAKSPYGSWQILGSYGTESQAISMALSKKNKGAILVRVLDKSGKVLYSN
jgi:hypothetical protein